MNLNIHFAFNPFQIPPLKSDVRAHADVGLVALGVRREKIAALSKLEASLYRIVQRIWVTSPSLKVNHLVQSDSEPPMRTVQST